MVLTIGFSRGAYQLMSLVVRLCSCSSSTTRHLSVPDEGSSGRSFSLLLHVFATLAANHCCLQSKITGVGVSPDSLIGVPRGVLTSCS